MQPIKDLVARLVEAGGSDLYLKAGAPPSMRVHGSVQVMDGLPPLSPADTEAAANELLRASRLEHLRTRGDAETAISYPGLGRYRVNVYRQRGVIGVVARRVLTKIPRIQDLDLQPFVQDLAEEPRGMLLFIGPSGVGAPSPLAAVSGHYYMYWQRIL